MFKRIIQIAFSLIGIALGYSLFYIFEQSEIIQLTNIFRISGYILFALIFGIGFFMLTPKVHRHIQKILDKVDCMLQKLPTIDIVIGAVGLLFGFIIAFFISIPISTLNLPAGLNVVFFAIIAMIYLILGSLGVRISIKKKGEIKHFFSGHSEKKFVDTKNKDKFKNNVKSKIIDTSVLIDGRILPIVSTGFVEGKLIIPQFVLQELQYIADSADSAKRERGRRGLDIVKDLKEINKVSIEVSNKEYDLTEVDAKLLKMALDTDSIIITNDYNLNKLASVQGIKVLNINDLANSVKTIVVPGEIMKVVILKEGREKKQGIAYLDDGTMIVVEDSKHLIGEEIHIEVTTIYQTSAGKMIFAKPI